MSKQDSSDDIELNFDVSKIKKIFSGKILKACGIILLLLIPILLTIFIRLEPQNLTATDNWAQSSVQNYYKSNIAQQINAQYPNLPTTQKQKLIDEQYLQFQKTNKDQIKEQVTQTSIYFKSGFQYQDNGTTHAFLGDLDSYFYLRQAENVADHGNVCDQVVDGKCIDSLMIATETRPAVPSMHPHATVVLYNFLHIFNSKINLMDAAFLLPTVVAIIAVISAFFLARKLMNNVAGFFAAMFIAVSPLLISRTLGSDTDIWNIMFPILIMWIFIEAFEAKTLLKKIILTATTSILFSAFCFAWSGWWYIFDFIIIGLIAYVGFELIKHYIKHKRIEKTIIPILKDNGILLASLIVFTAIFTTLFVSFEMFKFAFTAPLELSGGLKVAATQELWGNILTTVAELNEAGIGTIISQTAFGINILFSIAMLGIIFTLVKRQPDSKEYMLIIFSAIVYLFLISTKALNMNPLLYLALLSLPLVVAIIMLFLEKESKVDVKAAFILMIWFVGMIFASIKGVRFILLITPVFSIAIGIAIGYIYQYLTRIMQNSIKMNEILSKVLVFIVLALILITPIRAGIATGESYMPSMTTGWWDSLTKIKMESEPDAIITSWWDFGHWFKYVADRRVTFDGASQLPPLGHWIGKSLQTNNEAETIGIIRMVDCGSNRAFEIVNQKFNDTEKSENIISAMIIMNKSEAKEYLTKLEYSDSQINKILDYSHCTPPEAYYITSEDMVGKAGVWAHFGTWNIDKAYIINNLKDKPLEEAVQTMIERWNYTEDQATSIYYEIQTLTTDREMNDWIAPWPSYGSSSMIPCSVNKDVVYCNINVAIGSNSLQNIILERSAMNISNPENAQAIIGIYDKNTNAKLGENIVEWSKIVIADKTLKTYKPYNATLSMGLLIQVNKDNTTNTTTYNALMADPLLIDSTFTKLFFLDGKYTENFEKFSDITDITGSRIIVWKVKW
jgi:dolichyl-diphosphooligosaccharide--protein glycosyltransferase